MMVGGRNRLIVLRVPGRLAGPAGGCSNGMVVVVVRMVRVLVCVGVLRVMMVVVMMTIEHPKCVVDCRAVLFAVSNRGGGQ